jgi:hypothetical protein
LRMHMQIKADPPQKTSRDGPGRPSCRQPSRGGSQSGGASRSMAKAVVHSMTDGHSKVKGQQHLGDSGGLGSGSCSASPNSPSSSDRGGSVHESIKSV